MHHLLIKRIFPCLILLAGLLPRSQAGEKLLIIGDSLSKEYEITFRGIPGIAGICPNNPAAWKARNWAETLQRLRKPWFDMGEVNWYADFRIYGHRYNWAFATGRASEIKTRLFSKNILDQFWQATFFEAVKQDAERIVIFCGGNDINASYGALYNGQVTGDSVITPISQDIQAIVKKIRAKDARVPIVLVSVPHPGTSPDVRLDHPFDTVKTGRVTRALARLNSQLRQFAIDRGIGYADIVTPTLPLLRGYGIYIGGVPFFNKADDDSRPRYLFACDGFHPNTPLQAGIGAIILNAFQEKYPETGLTAMTEREILQKVIRVNPDLAFTLWAKAKGLTGPHATMDADKDGDGLNHLEEMAFNLDPNLNDTHLLPKATEENINGQNYAVISWRPLPRYSGYLSITPQYSLTGGPWDDVPEGSVTKAPNGTYTLRIPQIKEPVSFSFLVDRLGVAGSQPNPIEPGAPQLSATVSITEEIWLNLMPPVDPGRTVSIPYTATLSNNSATEKALFAPTPCDVFTWEIRNANGQVVAGKPTLNCIQVIAEETLPAGQTLTHDSSITLPVNQLVPDATYTLTCRYWGQTASTTFTVKAAY